MMMALAACAAHEPGHTFAEKPPSGATGVTADGKGGSGRYQPQMPLVLQTPLAAAAHTATVGYAPQADPVYQIASATTAAPMGGAITSPPHHHPAVYTTVGGPAFPGLDVTGPALMPPTAQEADGHVSMGGPSEAATRPAGLVEAERNFSLAHRNVEALRAQLLSLGVRPCV